MFNVLQQVAHQSDFLVEFGGLVPRPLLCNFLRKEVEAIRKHVENQVLYVNLRCLPKCVTHRLKKYHDISEILLF